MDIKVGDFEVLANGTIVGNEQEPIDFIFDNASGFIIRIFFKSDSSIPSPTVQSDKYDKIGGQFTFINFDNSIGIGNISPIKIGVFKNRDLLLNYRVYSLNKGGKSFHYTWLLGKEVEDGK
jgi:hypothetical protein